MSGPDGDAEPDFFWRIWPNPRREGPKWTDWGGLALVVVLLAGCISAGVFWRTIGCGRPLPSATIWYSEGACVGVSDGGYTFGDDDFYPAVTLIAEQNRAVRDGTVACRANSTMTVAAMLALGSSNAGGRSAHELEGLAVAQAEINSSRCDHRVILEIANMGAAEQAADQVADMVKSSPDVVAVVGMGLSSLDSARAANTLGDTTNGVPVPMIASVITATGFDSRGLTDQGLAFPSCRDDKNEYSRGVGFSSFYSVAFRNYDQIESLHKTFPAPPNLRIIAPRDDVDPYTCTAVDITRSVYGGSVPVVKFDPADELSVSSAVGDLCSGHDNQEVTAFYNARSADLGSFIEAIDHEYEYGQCHPRQITILSPSDANRLLTPEPGSDPNTSGPLDAEHFKNGDIKLFFANLTNSAPLTRDQRQMISDLSGGKIDPVDFADGWAVNSHDALIVAAQAAAGNAVSRGTINTALPRTSTDGLGGRIQFSERNVRIGSPPVLQICSATASGRAADVPVTAELTDARCSP